MGDDGAPLCAQIKQFNFVNCSSQTALGNDILKDLFFSFIVRTKEKRQKTMDIRFFLIVGM